MLKNKSILLPKDSEDGVRVCVMNSIHPEYEFDMWLPCLAPSRELVEKYVINETISWEEFEVEYVKEQKESASASEALKALKYLIEVAGEAGKDVTLLCFEEEIEKCHRKLIVENLGSI